MRELSTARRESLIQSLLEEIAQPMGVPSEFVVEFFAPTLDEYHVFHNLDQDAADDAPDDETGELDADQYDTNTEQYATEDDLADAHTLDSAVQINSPRSERPTSDRSGERTGERTGERAGERATGQENLNYTGVALYD